MAYRPDYESADYLAGYADGKAEATKEWQGLSDDEIKRKSWDNTQSDGFYDGAKWAEQALKEKNT